MSNTTSEYISWDQFSCKQQLQIMCGYDIFYTNVHGTTENWVAVNFTTLTLIWT
jgi:hypothetical protein